MRKKIIKSEKRGFFNVAFRQGRILKRFKEKKRFEEIIKELGGSRSTVYFKIKDPKMKKLSLTFPNFIFQSFDKACLKYCEQIRENKSKMLFIMYVEAGFYESF